MKNILIIGGSKGISSAVAQLCLDKGYQVFTACRTQPELSNVQHINYDVLDPASTLENLPDRIDGMVYAPGSINLRPFRALRPETFQSDFDINVMGFVRSMKTVLPNLLVSEQASVVLYSTVAVQQGMPFHASVAAAKGALEGLTRSLAAEYAPKIRVNAVAPSLTQTPLAGKLLSSEEKIEKMNERHPLKRIGTPQDMAEITCFLLSESSSWMTGQILGVDGGMSSLKIN
ncbi:MAG: SDR family oxidoreductase [Flavobacteriaceae bacterium]|nr:SDR family oxidoreductase [Flavobacteriaceae bacterium]